MPRQTTIKRSIFRWTNTTLESLRIITATLYNHPTSIKCFWIAWLISLASEARARAQWVSAAMGLLWCTRGPTSLMAQVTLIGLSNQAISITLVELCVSRPVHRVNRWAMVRIGTCLPFHHDYMTTIGLRSWEEWRCDRMERCPPWVHLNMVVNRYHSEWTIMGIAERVTTRVFG